MCFSNAVLLAKVRVGNHIWMGELECRLDGHAGVCSPRCGLTTVLLGTVTFGLQRPAPSWTLLIHVPQCL
jgi:hypothetical protein